MVVAVDVVDDDALQHPKHISISTNEYRNFISLLCTDDMVGKIC